MQTNLIVYCKTFEFALYKQFVTRILIYCLMKLIHIFFASKNRDNFIINTTIHSRNSDQQKIDILSVSYHEIKVQQIQLLQFISFKIIIEIIDLCFLDIIPCISEIDHYLSLLYWINFKNLLSSLHVHVFVHYQKTILCCLIYYFQHIGESTIPMPKRLHIDQCSGSSTIIVIVNLCLQLLSKNC